MPRRTPRFTGGSPDPQCDCPSAEPECQAGFPPPECALRGLPCGTASVSCSEQAEDGLKSLHPKRRTYVLSIAQLKGSVSQPRLVTSNKVRAFLEKQQEPDTRREDIWVDAPSNILNSPISLKPLSHGSDPPSAR